MNGIVKILCLFSMYVCSVSAGITFPRSAAPVLSASASAYSPKTGQGNMNRIAYHPRTRINSRQMNYRADYGSYPAGFASYGYGHNTPNRPYLNSQYPQMSQARVSHPQPHAQMRPSPQLQQYGDVWSRRMSPYQFPQYQYQQYQPQRQQQLSYGPYPYGSSPYARQYWK